MAAVQVASSFSPLEQHHKSEFIQQSEQTYNDSQFDPVNKEKKKEEFRNYDSGARQKRVSDFYLANHSFQTLDFVNATQESIKFQHMKMSVWEAFELLQKIVDDSDPDTNWPQMYHGFQTAEAIRQAFPDDDWFHLTGLIHDLGKVLAAPCFQLSQWAIVGDTFPVGCKFSDKNVFPEFFAQNPDSGHPVYSTELGIYEKNCGLMNLTMSYGHDEYLYQVLKNNPNCKLPPHALYIIRFHSFYAWHKYGGYQQFTNEYDRTEGIEWILKFNQFDLYSKSMDPPKVDELKKYYQGLIEKYLPGCLNW
jgi:inositol oxygenase